MAITKDRFWPNPGAGTPAINVRSQLQPWFICKSTPIFQGLEKIGGSERRNRGLWIKLGIPSRNRRTSWKRNPNQLTRARRGTRKDSGTEHFLRIDADATRRSIAKQRLAEKRRFA